MRPDIYEPHAFVEQIGTVTEEIQLSLLDIHLQVIERGQPSEDALDCYHGGASRAFRCLANDALSVPVLGVADLEVTKAG